MAIRKLEKEFIQEQVLHSEEMNQISEKIDEIIDAVNSSSSITGVTYIVTVSVDGANNGNLYYMRSDASAILKASAITTKVYIADGSRQVMSDANYKASVEVEDANGNYVTVRDSISVSGNDFINVDIKAYLTTTARRVRVTFTETATSASDAWVGSAMLTTMSLSPANVLWENAYIQGTSYSFGTFYVTGTLDKTVYLRVYNDEGTYDDTSSSHIGTTTYTSGGYYFVLSKFPSAGTGVYKFEIWVASGVLESAHYTYNMMCVASSEASTAQLVCINNLGTEIVNATSCRLFDYAIYNGGNSTSGTSIESNVRQRITATYGGLEHEIYNSLLSQVPAARKNSLNYNVDLATDEQNPTLTASLIYGNATESASFTVDNSSSYPATSGAVFYMNPATRSNAQANKESVVNETNASQITTVWTKVAFVDGMDGWTTDDEGRACLAINAGSKCQINYAPLNDLTSGYCAIEITYKASVVSNYLENIITIASDPLNDDFKGIRIRPDEVCVHSNMRLSSFDNVQNYHTDDEELVNLVVVFTTNYKQTFGNFCHIFVNGAIKCEFALNTGDTFNSNAPIILGSSSANLYVYNIRVYNSAFGFLAATNNYIASLPTMEEKRGADARESDIMDEDGDISYAKVVASTKANYFVVEMVYKEDESGRAIDPWLKPTIPSYSDWSKKEYGRANLEFHFGEHPEWDWKITEVEYMGQGTTSMNYWRWNFRARIDKTNTVVGSTTNKKKVYVQYGWNKSTGTWGNAALSTTVKFDGNTHDPVMRITGKKNYASSQQSHKMGTTGAYNDLHDACIGANEAEGRTAVFQYPAYGFVRTKDDNDNPMYEFIGLFTVGPDKGDKPTFKYNGSLKGTLMTMEGLDHDKRLAVFRYPWNNDVVFADESLSITTSDGYDAGWEVGNCYGLETAGTAQDDADVMAMLVREFKPAYELAYLNSPFIMGLDPTASGNDINSINANVTDFGTRRNENDDDRPFVYYEFYYDGDYNLYYLDIKENKYKQSGVNVLSNLGMTLTTTLNANILKKLGLSDLGVFGDFNTDTDKAEYVSIAGHSMNDTDELDAGILRTMGKLSISTIGDLVLAKKDEYFREVRRRRFKVAMDASDSPWDLDDCLFCHTFLVLFGATDNHAKNSYPYKFKSLSEGGKWRWRQDDLDTIFDTDNQGHSAKKYSIEFKDWSTSSQTARVFKGEDSSFWTLIEQCYQDEIREMGRNILDKMIALGGSSDSNTLTKLMAFFHKYYWDKAQDYFTKGAYNHDARYSYEDAYLPYKNGTYRVDVNPVEQSHGDSLESEMYWVERRLVYCMSKFRYGPFASYSDASLGQIVFRTQDPQRFNLTPAMDLYPCIMSGQGRNFYFDRTEDGEVGTMDSVGGSNTAVYIVAADYLRSIGDLSQFRIDDTTTTNLQISSKRLETLKIGDVDSTRVTTRLGMLTLSNCPSLITIDARNTSNLSGSIDLTNCPRIRQVYLTGTQVAGISFAEGCKLETLTLPSTMTAIVLKNLKFLSSLDVTACAPNVKSVDIEGCTMLHSFQILKNIYYSNNLQGTNALTFIRITDIDETVTSAEDPNGQIAEMLYRISKGLDADAHEKNYYALDAQGRETTDTAYISGTIHFEKLIVGYKEAIEAYFPYLQVTVESGGIITPDAETIGLALSGDETTRVYEDDVPNRLTFYVSASNEVYKSVTWAVYGLASNISFGHTKDYAYLDFTEFTKDGTNTQTTKEITITATSTWNNLVTISRRVFVYGIKMTGIVLASDTLYLNNLSGVRGTLSLTYSPENTTKEDLVRYVYDDDLLSVYNNVVSARGAVFSFADFYAIVSGEVDVVSNTLRFYLNDYILIDTANNSWATKLLGYIHNTLKVSDSATELYASEASKVTTLNRQVQNNTTITSFAEFKFFASVKQSTGYEFSGCTNLAYIEFPESYTNIGYTDFANTAIQLLEFPVSINCNNAFYNAVNLVKLKVNGTITSTNPSLCRNDAKLTTIEADMIIINANGEHSFNGCSALETIPPIKITENCTNLQYFMNGCSSATSASITNDSDTSKVTSFANTFANCSSIVDWTFLDNVDFSSNTSFATTFKGSSLNYFDWLDNLLDVSKVTQFGEMFSGIDMSGITSLPFLSTMVNRTDTRGGIITNAPDLVEMNFANLVRMGTWYVSAFSGIGSVQKIYLPKFERSGSTTYIGNYFLFDGCPLVKFLFLPKFVHYYNLLGCSGAECIDIGADIIDMPFSNNDYNNAFWISTSTSCYYWVFRTETPPVACNNYNAYVNLYKTVYSKLASTYIFLPSQTAITNFESATGWSRYAGRYFIIGGTEWVAKFGKTDAYADVDYYGYDRTKAGVPTTY